MTKSKKSQENKAKNLTLTELRKQDKALNEQTEHTINVNGVDYKIKIDNVFRKTKQHKLLDDLIKFMDEGRNNEELLDFSSSYTTLLLIKHFTSLEIPDDIDNAIIAMNALIDLDIFDEIINLMPEKEVVKVYELLAMAVKRIDENIDEMIEEASKVTEKIENKEVKELLQNGEEKLG